jgi:hypothetical protein
VRQGPDPWDSRPKPFVSIRVSLAPALSLIGGILIRKKARNWLEHGHITKRCIRAIRPIRMDCSGWSASKQMLVLSVCAAGSSGNGA